MTFEGHFPAVVTLCAQLTHDLLAIAMFFVAMCRGQMEATSPTATFDPFSRPPSTLDGTSDYASASRRTSICTSVTSVSDWHSTVSL